LRGSLSYLDQDYGLAPGSFHYFSPRSNYWLDGWDRFTVANMASFGLERFAAMDLLFLRDGGGEGGSRPRTRFRLVGVARGAGEALEYLALEACHEYPLPFGCYVQGDFRSSYYPGNGRGFLDPYLEAGYRQKGIEVSLGYGVDPIAFDPVRNDYYRVGRVEYLRGALAAAGGKAPPRGYDLKAALLSREEDLSREGGLKIELVVVF